MPQTTPASNAFPSSNNSSTLSESALSSFDNPCRSPDSNPETLREGSSSEVSGWSLFHLTLPTALGPAVFAGAFFPTAVLSGIVLGVDNRFFAGCCDILVAFFFDPADFVPVFFLVAMREV